jgi:mannosylglycoprotein endo-beta-mannosidase
MLRYLTTGVLLLAAWWWTPGCAPTQVAPQGASTHIIPSARELNTGWVCRNVRDVEESGEMLSDTRLPLEHWLPATVPGTVLTTLLNNHLVPDPFVGMNNLRIPDIFEAGREYYTYWFVNDFREAPPARGGQIWLRFRGINYSCDIYLNGHKLNARTHYGMFLRQEYNITSFISGNDQNRLAVLVYPPDPVGNPNGGQGGDGTIGRNVASQFTAGWDWIQPVRDRNTGIWDKVTLVETNGVLLKDPHVITDVPGRRFPDRPQAPARIRASIEIENPAPGTIEGTVLYHLDGTTVREEVRVPPASTMNVDFPDLVLDNPRLWWPNGYGPQPLYPMIFQFVRSDGTLLDEKTISLGVREIQTVWNDHTRSREVLVNGQRIFIKGGNWITSDAMLRFSPERYDAEVRFHRDMNLNLIRIWGGSITERPEFYDACDRYGLLVFQDFWMSGDCNGKWLDPMKKEDQWTRRTYPDDHALFLSSVADQVKMLRNHPSLAFYCGGNEIPPPEDILAAMQDSVLPALDGTRYFFTYSNVDSMSYNIIGGNGDGAYHLQPVEQFWANRSFPFNSEIGSVGMGDEESLKRFIPPGDLVMPDFSFRKLDSVWRYHRYLPYWRAVNPYGKPIDLKAFADRAQLVNFDQYRGLIEGHLAHMWDWYTGLIIWKTQNPWTALRGQMYDYYLDPNAALYGLHHANEPLHVMLNPLDRMVVVVNHTFLPYHDLMVQARAIGIDGRDSLALQWFVEISPGSVQNINSIKKVLDTLFAALGGFVDLRLLNSSRQLLSENLYWLPDSTGSYSGMQQMGSAALTVSARTSGEGRIEVTARNPPGGPLAFFNRISLVDSATATRILPVFYSDNYVSVLPGEERTVTIDYPPTVRISDARVSVTGWNVKEQFVAIR